MRHVKRHTLATAVLLTVLSTATACSSDSDDSTGDTMTLSGNCSITDHSLSRRPWSLSPWWRSCSDPTTGPPSAGCRSPPGHAREGFRRHLRHHAGQRQGRRAAPRHRAQERAGYAEAQRVLATGTGEDTAFTKVAEDTYVTPDVTGDSDGNRLKGAKGVKVTPDYAVVVEILHPAEGVDAMKEAGPTVQAVADNLAHLG